MTPETEALIARVLAHDAKATKGPWAVPASNVHRVLAWSGDDPVRLIVEYPDEIGGYGGLDLSYWTMGGKAGGAQSAKDRASIADFRTAAPKLARMLREAIKGLQLDETRGDTEETLAEIERIAKGES